MEPIKQEIINNIFENGDKLITGPILQTVLIDMIDDVNVKDQEILSKTGSWDEAATQIPNLATKAEVTNLSESVARDLENVVGGDLTGYATEQWVESQGYLKEHQDISNLATKAELTEAENNLQGNITSLSESVARDIANVSVPEGVATETWVQSQDYASKTYVNEAVSSSSVDLTGYATETWVQSQGYLREHQDISNLATKSELTSVSESVQTDIINLSESVANSAVWKKGTGTDSVVQVIADGTNLPIASGKRAIAEGQGTKATGENSHAEGDSTEASGGASHAEGFWTEAPGNNSHAEGGNTKASGQYSHAEGWYAETSNDYEHAQGQYNHNSKNQIFSVGAGEITPPDYHITKRNAVSILVVPNAETQINTASFFVQNIGGYDGTNPLPGANDLATVINNLPSGGGSSETLWKKGTGEDSLVQKLTGNNEANTPTASGTGAVAIGTATTASGNNSHAEGQTTVASGLASHAEGYNTIASAHCSHAEGGDTKASGSYSHAEGIYTEALGQASHTEGYRTTASREGSHAEGESTIASGSYSHAEGGYTLTSNQYEHAQGQYNHNSTNQIFSVGAGEKIGETVTRRNAVSILEVPNSDTQVVTASVFVQNIGGYDGTNPEPGTNDLATVINGMSSGGGSSETLWEKGTGKDSLVQVIADGTGLPTATEERAIATGYATVASGMYSNAEGENTKASGYCSHAEGESTEAPYDLSHAEGGWTKTSGYCSHAEGFHTITSNQYEHAQGTYNHNSANQIFSIGTGNSNTDRRNALSVLAITNADGTEILTSSVFIQNIGGYDGTNPTPGTNDLATVINNLPSGGGSSETLWKKGTGTDSIVQVIADGTNLPTATGVGAVAIGTATTASGDYSHAEGDSTEASGLDSHAEGDGTKALSYASHAEGVQTNASNYASHAEGKSTTASGQYSHAEGYSAKAIGQYSHAEGAESNASEFGSHAEGEYTVASGVSSHAEGGHTVTSNKYEHAQGRYNYTSSNQIFSIGTGNRDNDRRNAVSVLEVSNNNKYTSSFFVQNVGGYDGTNPTPGTNDLATVINGLSSSGGSSETLWKKGEGQDSIVQVLTGANEAKTPTATGERAIATGYSTNASGGSSHAEGDNTKAKGYYSHAEGYWTEASGQASHAEGYETKTSNNYEHAQGIYNHSSTNQIFSVGAGNSNTDRRNAISVLAVSNNNSYTSSFFVQNVGGYDGTNPTPGTNDLATVLNNTETWTFTLEDGTTVTKNIRIS